MTERNGTQRPTSFWLDDDTLATLEKLASKTGMSRSGIMREAVRLMDADPKQAEIRKLVTQLAKAVGT